MMTKLASSSTKMQLAGKWSPEDERQLRQILRKLADDLIVRAQILRDFCSENCPEGVFNDPVLFCDENNCPYRRRFKKILADTVEELEKSKRSFKSKQLEALRKRLCKELVRM
jgi:hypothetical protein